uniref:Uncharacterized protein n=1 Tax=Opuntia streptacantha TaxID=393608 RepID=A0A7C9CZA1_OPUST
MSSPISFHPLKALPSLSPLKCRPSRCMISKHKLLCNSKPNQSSAAEPAFAVTGVNNEQDLISVVIQIGVLAFWYFLIMPPIIMNWLRTRWYRRNLLEMYLQFMCVFMFFPGVMLWAPFLNFRKFPRDPTLKYPWSKPENPSEVKGGFLKFPWATIEDYE